MLVKGCTSRAAGRAAGGSARRLPSLYREVLLHQLDFRCSLARTLPSSRRTITMAPTINSRKRSRQSNPTMPMRPEVRKLKEARQAEIKSVRKKPASMERYSVLNDQQTETSKEAPKQVFHRDTM
jgi:hypothetical protein